MGWFGRPTFGWGETCYRDIEAFLHRCCLVKPDMSHLMTWPDIYINEQTYVPLKWDFSDFEDQITRLLDDENYLVSIMESGYQLIKIYLGEGGDALFASHFKAILN